MMKVLKQGTCTPALLFCSGSKGPCTCANAPQLLTSSSCRRTSCSAAHHASLQPLGRLLAGSAGSAPASCSGVGTRTLLPPLPARSGASPVEGVPGLAGFGVGSLPPRRPARRRYSAVSAGSSAPASANVRRNARSASAPSCGACLVKVSLSVAVHHRHGCALHAKSFCALDVDDKLCMSAC